MQKLNVQVHDELFADVIRYMKKYRITRAAAVSFLLSYALEQLKHERPVKTGGTG